MYVIKKRIDPSEVQFCKNVQILCQICRILYDWKIRIRSDPDPHTAADRFVSKPYPLTGRRMICPYDPPEKYNAYTDLSRNTVTHPMFTKTQKRDKKEKA